MDKVKIELDKDLVNELIKLKEVGFSYSDVIRRLLNKTDKMDNKLVVKTDKIIKTDNKKEDKIDKEDKIKLPAKTIQSDRIIGKSKEDYDCKSWWNPQDYCSKHNVNHLHQEAVK